MPFSKLYINKDLITSARQKNIQDLNTTESEVPNLDR